MNTYKRKCLVNETIKDNEKEFKIKKGQIYRTSDIYNKEFLTVFSNYWCYNIPSKWFNAGIKC